MSSVIREILIKCRGCDVENIFNNYTPDIFLVCNQCRERLVEPDFCEIYKQFDCQSCGFTIFVMENTDFKIGESACRCGEINFQQMDPTPFLKEVEKSGGLELKDQPEDGGLDWYRSEPTQDDSYDTLFDKDHGSN